MSNNALRDDSLRVGKKFAVRKPRYIPGILCTMRGIPKRSVHERRILLAAKGGEYRETRLSTLLPPGFQPLRVLRDARKLARERGEKRDGGGRGGEGGEDDE